MRLGSFQKLKCVWHSQIQNSFEKMVPYPQCKLSPHSPPNIKDGACQRGTVDHSPFLEWFLIQHNHVPVTSEANAATRLEIKWHLHKGGLQENKTLVSKHVFSLLPPRNQKLDPFQSISLVSEIFFSSIFHHYPLRSSSASNRLGQQEESLF